LAIARRAEAANPLIYWRSAREATEPEVSRFQLVAESLSMVWPRETTARDQYDSGLLKRLMHAFQLTGRSSLYVPKGFPFGTSLILGTIISRMNDMWRADSL
jgi:hypothetical protein